MSATKDADPPVSQRVRMPQSWSENLPPDSQSRSTGSLLLLLACDRAKQLTTVNCQAVALLLETTNLYDTYGQALLQCSQAFFQSDNIQSCRDAVVVRGLVQWVEQRGTTYSHTLTKPVRNGNVLPLQKFLVTHGDCATHVPERCQVSGTAVAAVHQKRRAAQNAWQTADQEAAKSIAEWRNHNNSNNNNNNSNSESENYNPATAAATSFPKHVTTKLSQVLPCQARYKRFMDWEQECVRQRQRMQVMGLETMQKLEEDRLVIILHSLTQLLVALTSTPTSAIAKPERNSVTKVQQQRAQDPMGTPPKDANSNRRRRSGISVIDSIIESKTSVDSLEDDDPVADPSCSGVMDCETMGLPLDIGELRDQVCCEAAAKESTVQMARSLATLLDRVAMAARAFAQGLDAKVAVTAATGEELSHPVGFAFVGEEMKATAESSRIIELWSVLSNCLKKERDQALNLALEVESLRSEYLDPVIEYGNTVLTPAVKRDDATWKQLCGAARSQSDAESRFIETTAQTARVRERCKSCGDSAAVNASSLTATANKHVSQSLASMFSILPNGGEHAMKVLDASTRASVVQLSLDEANQREAKDRQMLDSATALTELSIEAYKTQAEKALKDFGETCLDLAPLARSFVSRVEQHCDFDVEVDELLSVDLYREVPATLDAWLSKAQAELVSLQTEEADVEDPTELVHSDIVRQCLAELNRTDVPLTEADTSMNDASETEDFDDMLIPPLSSPVRERAGSSSSWGTPTSNEERNTGWLLRSLTMPERNDSFFGKLSMKKIVPRMRQPKFDEISTETRIFASFFWPETGDPDSIPNIAESFACSFRDAAQRFPFQYGRLFLSSGRLIFVSWTRKTLTLHWSEVLAIESIKSSVTLQDDSIVVKCKKGSNDESYMMLSGFYDRQRTVELMQKFREQITAPENEPAGSPTDSLLGSAPRSPPKPIRTVPPDETLRKMQVILSRTIHNTSVQEFYDIVWSECNSTSETAFYKSFLERECLDVNVGAWDRNEITRSWCGETYTQSRLVKFRVKRTTHTYIGPPIAEVTQVQYNAQSSPRPSRYSCC